MSARIDAAAKRLHDMTCIPEKEVDDLCKSRARFIMAAADEAEASDAEKLAECLRDFIVYCEHYFSHTDSRAPWPTVGKAREILARRADQ